MSSKAYLRHFGLNIVRKHSRPGQMLRDLLQGKREMLRPAGYPKASEQGFAVITYACEPTSDKQPHDSTTYE